jgi:hypothetical protein
MQQPLLAQNHKATHQKEMQRHFIRERIDDADYFLRFGHLPFFFSGQQNCKTDRVIQNKKNQQFFPNGFPHAT